MAESAAHRQRNSAGAHPAMKQGGRCSDRQLGRGYGTAGMRCPSRKTKRPPAAGHQPRPCRARAALGESPGKAAFPPRPPGLAGPHPPEIPRATAFRPGDPTAPDHSALSSSASTREALGHVGVPRGGTLGRAARACLPVPESPVP